MANIDEQLATAQNLGLLIAIYNFIDEETFSVGYVAAQDETHVCLRVIDPDGALNGLQLISKAFINRIVLRSDYLRSTEVWEQSAKRRGYDDPWGLKTQTADISWDSQHLLVSLLRHALLHKRILALGTMRQLADDQAEDADFTGFVGDFVGDTIALNYLDPWHLSDAWQIDIKLNEINYLRIGAGACVKMQALFEKYTDETF